MEGRPTDAAVEAAESAHPFEPRVGRFQPALVLATLSSKRVWIPGATAMLLGLIGAAMAWMPPQAAQQKARLQVELPATQKKREPAGVAKKEVAPAAADAPPPIPADVPADMAVDSAAADARPGIDDGECQVSDRASVARNLKNCIDSFNRSTPGRADRPTRKVAANGPGER